MSHRLSLLPLPAGLMSLLLAAGLATAADTPWSQGPVVCYDVPAISSIPRLPDELPEDGRPSTRLRVVAAQGEYEPASFVIAPRADVTSLVLKASALQGPGGTIPAANVDLKVVKVWYQGGTAWYSYFGDSNRRELTPELLLNDENLLRVDQKTEQNELRVGGKYQSVSYPRSDENEAFNFYTEPVADSPTLQPIRLEKGHNKQIWITVHVPESAAGGVYQGKIELLADGKNIGAMELAVRVLPFALPMPKTYYDLDLDYLVTLYGTGVLDMCERLNIPQAEADQLQNAIYANLLKHNVFNCRSDLTLSYQKDRAKAIEKLKHELQLMKQAGFVMKPLLSRGWAYPAGEKDLDEYKDRIDDLVDTLVGEVGHKDIYITSWDEAGVDRIKIMRERARYTTSKGIKLWVSTHAGRHFDLAGYAISYANHGGWPARENVATWHALGAKVGSYAGPHTGPENPDIFRRMEGLARYKAYYDGSFNYKYFMGLHPTLYQRQKANLWNDFMGGAFRPMNLVYPTKTGVIDTLAFEGFREGIDDVRYATKLKQEAARAIASGNVDAIYTGKKALIWLELLDDKTVDLNAARMEMIEYILKIQAAMEH
ncbi:hypothetical protein [Lignipirellula cremea]|uniref:Glycoside hydrolase 123 C-terminal domain-containing protein n=1 Tax=Lignipirellula cremea TaxID=2528010 RepID=A0A518DYS9_9BACT|nr:hypothetical protein [Lignipirellula cremea]QDU96996.1 hypothetical protein Pla8534_48210 [Lignipirellula cremea]